MWHPVGGDGPSPCPIMIVGQRPGKWENRAGIPFCGDSGSELNGLYLRRARWDRHAVYVTNAVKCGDPMDRAPSNDLLHTCASRHLAQELAQVQPELVVALGAEAISLFTREDGVPWDIDRDHGMTFSASAYGWSGTVAPMYHPAAAMRATRMMQDLMDDFERVGKVMRVSPSQQPDDDLYVGHNHIVEEKYKTVTSGQLALLLARQRPTVVAVDTEMMWEAEDAPVASCQFSWRPGESYVVTGSEPELHRAWQAAADQAALVYHYAQHELRVARRLKVNVEVWHDTMLMAYRLRLPQGLKALAFRLCGMRMHSYTDMVDGPWRRDVQDRLYWWMALQKGAPRYHKTTRKYLGNAKPTFQTDVMRVARFALGETYELEDKAKVVMEEHGLSEMWSPDAVERLSQTFNVYHSTTAPAGAMTGPCKWMVPHRGLWLVDHDVWVPYAARDADATLRVYVRMRELEREWVRKGGRLYVRQGDRSYETR